MKTVLTNRELKRIIRTTNKWIGKKRIVYPSGRVEFWTGHGCYIYNLNKKWWSSFIPSAQDIFG